LKKIELTQDHGLLDVVPIARVRQQAGIGLAHVAQDGLERSRAILRK
jgi:hypothetical protein